MSDFKLSPDLFSGNKLSGSMNRDNFLLQFAHLSLNFQSSSRKIEFLLFTGPQGNRPSLRKEYRSMPGSKILSAVIVLAGLCWAGLALAEDPGERHAVPNEHPRLFGPRSRLLQLSAERSAEYSRMRNVALDPEAGDHERMISLSLVCAIEQDSALARIAIGLALNYINGPIVVGHETFGHDLARCAVVYDLCWPWWTDTERLKFHDYMNRTVDANVNSETSPFHNGWYGYKNWGIGLACYASYYENSKAPGYLATLEQDFRTRAAKCLELAGDGGGWAEGYYVNYWTYEWMFFCEVARFCEGLDYYEIAPKFFRNRAVAGMFEAYPGIRDYGSRRPVPMGDGGGRVFGGDRDKALSARRILASRYRDDPSLQAVHAFNETTPRSSVGVYAYKDFLWHDTSVPKGSLRNFRLSWLSPGAGYVYARSSWNEDATYFFFKCGDRYTSHQHLDVGHFNIFKYEELAGDGGHYDAFGTSHDVNYHLRTIAHSTVLVYNQSETWRSDIRAGTVIGNDGGQAYPWASHNGAAVDVTDWQADRAKYDIADIQAFQDRGDLVYVAGDCSRAYSPNKLEYFYRQIVYLRPNRFVVFDRVKSKTVLNTKTWLLQAMKIPTGTPPELVITNGRGRLFVRTVLPTIPAVKLNSGSGLYTYGGRTYPPSSDTGPAPECRVEIAPLTSENPVFFLHVFEAADSTVARMAEVTRITEGDTRVGVRIDDGSGAPVEVLFARDGTMAARVRTGAGAFEDLASTVDTSVPEVKLRGDFNADGRLGLSDVLLLLLRGARNPLDPELDFNGDGVFSLADALDLVKYLRSQPRD
jgi:hypothetical protein